MPAPTAFPGFPSPAAGFEQPFEMLTACHDRVRRSLALLGRLCQHMASHGADSQARQAAADVLRYFSLAAPAHHEDEERHVVPALQARGDVASLRAAQRLLDDHAAIRAGWARLAPLLHGASAGEAPPQAALEAAARQFIDVHDGHLMLEDELAFPAAAEQIARQGEPAIEAMGREMAGRRHAPPDKR